MCAHVHWGKCVLLQKWKSKIKDSTKYALNNHEQLKTILKRYILIEIRTVVVSRAGRN